MFASHRHHQSSRKRGFFAPLTYGHDLPPWGVLTRAQCPASWQTAAAVHGTTFIAYDQALAANTPRYHYVPALGKRILLIEPARTNVGNYGNFVDAAPANGVPDGWVNPWCADISCPSGAPHGGVYFQLGDCAHAPRGVYNIPTVPFAAGDYVYSIWTRRTAAGAVTYYTFTDAAGVPYTMPGDATIHDWKREVSPVTAAGAGGGATDWMMAAQTDPAGLVGLVTPQLEAAKTASTWVPTPVAAVATRLIETFAIDPTVVPCAAGAIEWIWVPEFSSGDAIDTDWHVNWTWDNSVHNISYQASTRKIRWYNGVTFRTDSAAQVFSAFDPIRIRAEFGAAGTRLYVANDPPVDDPAAWVVPPATAPRLGSYTASAFQSPGLYCDLCLVGG